MTMFIRIDPDFLKEISTHNEHTPRLYFYGNAWARNFFWRRLEISHELMLKYVNNKENCLDLGCGNGVFLPTLAKTFQNVIGLDIETREAEKILVKYGSDNIKLINGDVHTTDFGDLKFDAICALDVLEHFKDPYGPILKAKEWLKEDGYFFTSLPTEGFFTIMSRKLSGTKKPFDHYHTGAEVEKMMEKAGFKRVGRIVFSWLFPMYFISAWKK